MNKSFEVMTIRRRAVLVCCFIQMAASTFDLVVDDGVSLASIDSFEKDVSGILGSVQFAWDDLLLYPKLTSSFMVYSSIFPSRDEFENFGAGNIYWNPMGVVFEVEWIPIVESSLRPQYEAMMRKVVPDFKIFTFGDDGKVERPSNYSNFYMPITYCTPRSDPLLGLDLHDDVEGPSIMKALASGSPVSSDPFDGRIADPSKLQQFDGFFKLMGIYFPIYIQNGTYQQQKQTQYAGTLAAVIAFHRLIANLLQNYRLSNIDVFMFWIKTNSGIKDGQYVAHFESGPNSSKPMITPEQANLLKPSDIHGDIVTNFSTQSNFDLFGRTFRFLVRLRKGAASKDVLIFCSKGSLLSRCSKMAICCTNEQQGSFSVVAQNAAGHISYQVFGQTVDQPQNLNYCGSGGQTCNFSLSLQMKGVYIVSIFLDGAQVSNSPILVEVSARKCTGDLRSDENGFCVCPIGTFSIGTTCARYDVVVPAIVVPVVVVLLLTFAGIAYCSMASVNTNPQWKIHESELEFIESDADHSLGSAALVRKAIFRGTPVVVKRFRHSSRNADVADVEAALQDNSERSGSLRSGSLRSGSVRSGSDDSFSVDQTQQIPSPKPKTGLNSTERLKRRMVLIASLRHPCLVTVMGIADMSRPDFKGLALVMEYVEFGSLSDLLANPTFPLRAEAALRVVRDVAQGMQFLHEADPPVLHGDLRSAHILVDRAFVARISDFGQISRFTAGHSHSLWAAPERLRGGHALAPADVWSFGVIISEVLTRRPPYDECIESNLFGAIVAGEVRPRAPPGCSTEIAALVSDCVRYEPSHRAPFGELNRRLAVIDNDHFDSPGVFAPPESTLGSLSHSDAGSAAYPNLPHHVQVALAEGRKVPPEPKEMVSILFSDVSGFTTISSELTAQKVSQMLERLFDQFDRIAERHGIFKVETIGDAYICATNVIEDQSMDHALLLARFATEAMQAANQTLIDEDDPDRGCVSIRIGLHAGPCMACVVGRLHPKYTLLGDTVNVASRMESTSVPGRIQCSSIFAKLLITQDPAASLQSRGKVEIKGKGAMSTFWLVHVSSSDESARRVRSHGTGSLRVLTGGTSNLVFTHKTLDRATSC